MVKKSDDNYIPTPYVPADAVAKQAKPGYKAGNPIIDEVNENIRRDTIIKKFKKLYDNFFKRKK